MTLKEFLEDAFASAPPEVIAEARFHYCSTLRNQTLTCQSAWAADLGKLCYYAGSGEMVLTALAAQFPDVIKQDDAGNWLTGNEVPKPRGSGQ